MVYLTYKIRANCLLGAIFASCLAAVYKKDSDCRSSVSGKEYMGHVNMTSFGTPCQHWVSQTPMAHPYMEDRLFPEGSVMEAQNFCRNPDGSEHPWCYTSIQGTPLKVDCKIPLCYKGCLDIEHIKTVVQNSKRHRDCLLWAQKGPEHQGTCTLPVCDRRCMTDSIGDTFIGPVTLDVDGITCVQWKDLEVQNELIKLGVTASDFQDHTLEEAQNYCRNPNVDPNGPWCYVRQEGRLTKKTCSVLHCDKLNEPHKIGCVELEAELDTVNDAMQSPDMTEELCHQFCKGKPVAGLMDDLCFCGYHISRSIRQCPENLSNHSMYQLFFDIESSSDKWWTNRYCSDDVLLDNSTIQLDSDRMSLQLCVHYCVTNAFLHAAVTNSTLCICTNTKPSNSSDERSCKQFLCPATDVYHCGGPQLFVVFDLINSLFVLPRVQRSYLGCFSRHILLNFNFKFFELSKISDEECISYCLKRGDPYAGIQGDLCACMSLFGLYGAKPALSSERMIHCKGDNMYRLYSVIPHSCQRGWLEFSGSCYRVSQEIPPNLVNLTLPRTIVKEPNTYTSTILPEKCALNESLEMSTCALTSPMTRDYKMVTTAVNDEGEIWAEEDKKTKTLIDLILTLTDEHVYVKVKNHEKEPYFLNAKTREVQKASDDIIIFQYAEVSLHAKRISSPDINVGDCMKPIDSGLTQFNWTSLLVTPERCLTYCLSQPRRNTYTHCIIGFKREVTCICLKSSLSLESTDNDNCRWRCPLSPGRNCGGPNAWRHYTTSYKIEHSLFSGNKEFSKAFVVPVPWSYSPSPRVKVSFAVCQLMCLTAGNLECQAVLYNKTEKYCQLLPFVKSDILSIFRYSSGRNSDIILYKRKKSYTTSKDSEFCKHLSNPEASTYEMHASDEDVPHACTIVQRSTYLTNYWMAAFANCSSDLVQCVRYFTDKDPKYIVTTTSDWDFGETEISAKKETFIAIVMTKSKKAGIKFWDKSRNPWRHCKMNNVIQNSEKRTHVFNVTGKELMDPRCGAMLIDYNPLLNWNITVTSQKGVKYLYDCRLRIGFEDVTGKYKQISCRDPYYVFMPHNIIFTTVATVTGTVNSRDELYKIQFIVRFQSVQVNACKSERKRNGSGRVQVAIPNRKITCTWEFSFKPEEYIKITFHEDPFFLINSSSKCKYSSNNRLVIQRIRVANFVVVGKTFPKTFNSLYPLVLSLKMETAKKDAVLKFDYEVIKLYKINCINLLKRVIFVGSSSRIKTGPKPWHCHWIVYTNDRSKVIQLDIHHDSPSGRFSVQDEDLVKTYRTPESNRVNATVVSGTQLVHVRFTGKPGQPETPTFVMKTKEVEGSGCGGPRDLSRFGEEGTIECIDPPFLPLGLGICKPAHLTWDLKTNSSWHIVFLIKHIKIKNEKLYSLCTTEAEREDASIILTVRAVHARNNETQAVFTSCGFKMQAKFPVYEAASIEVRAKMSRSEEIVAESWKMNLLIHYQMVPDLPDGLDITSESYVSDGNKFRDHFKYNKDLQSLFLIKGQGEWLHFRFLKAVLLIRFDLILRRKHSESGNLNVRVITGDHKNSSTCALIDGIVPEVAKITCTDSVLKTRDMWFVFQDKAHILPREQITVFSGVKSVKADSSWVSGETDERLLYLQPLSYDDAMEICRIFGANLLKKIDEKAKIMMKLNDVSSVWSNNSPETNRNCSKNEVVPNKLSCVQTKHFICSRNKSKDEYENCFPCQHGVSNSHIRCTVIGQCESISFLPYPPALIMSSAKLTTTTTWHIRTKPIYVIKLILQRVSFTGVDSFCSSSQIVVSENPADLNTILSTCLIKNVEHVTRSSQIDISMIASAEAFPWVVEIEYSQSNTTDVPDTGGCHEPWVAYKESCYILNIHPRPIVWNEADFECRRTGSYLVDILDIREQRFIQQLLLNKDAAEFNIFIGVSIRKNTYPKWSSGAPFVFELWQNQAETASTQDVCGVVSLGKGDYKLRNWFTKPCSQYRNFYFICKRRVKHAEPLSYHDMFLGRQSCPPRTLPCSGVCIMAAYICDGSVSCREDYKIHCGSLEQGTDFLCADGKIIPMYKVCDGSLDCLDKTDEVSCAKTGCAAQNKFPCGGGKCYDPIQKCDGIPHCPDGSDETRCYSQRSSSIGGTLEMSCNVGRFPCHTGRDCMLDRFLCIYIRDKEPPVGCLDMSHLSNCDSHKCPAYHVKCQQSYCIPMSYLCDGIQDCPTPEDELQCSPPRNMPPGMIQCLRAKGFYHPALLCDGIKHCKHGDDEAFCDALCPKEASCIGLTLVATGKKLSKFVCKGNTRALHLDRNYINPDTLDVRDCPDLVYLNLQRNSITRLKLNSFKLLSGLYYLDLSWNMITNLNGSLASLNYLRILRLDHNYITSLDLVSLESLTKLQKLYLKANTLVPNMEMTNQFKMFTDLILLSTDESLFCCFFDNPELLCDAPVDEISSCSELLKNGVLRSAVWIMSFMALAGNLVPIISNARVIKQHRKLSKQVRAHVLLVFQLGVADLLMGIYLFVIANVDTYFQGNFVAYSYTWKRAILCQMIGTCAVISAESSLVILALIAIDRCVAILYPFKYGKGLPSATAYKLSLISWMVASTIAVFPLMPLPYFSGFYCHSSICLPLFLTLQAKSGWQYTVAVFLGLNTLMIGVIVLSGVFTYQAVKKAGQIRKSSGSKDLLLAGRLTVLVLCSLLCWLPIIIILFLSLTGVVIPFEVDAWVTVFALPLNSAVNPFLYSIQNLKSTWRSKPDAGQAEAAGRPIPITKADLIIWSRAENIRMLAQYVADVISLYDKMDMVMYSIAPGDILIITNRDKRVTGVSMTVTDLFSGLGPEGQRHKARLIANYGQLIQELLEINEMTRDLQEVIRKGQSRKKSGK